ncbi:MAG: site-specific integrase [Clostridia bacterium]|nr:site-specific integrase [Clostridia bacterium]
MAKTTKQKGIKANITTKRNKYIIVLSWYNDENKRQQKWVSTDLDATPENKELVNIQAGKIRQEYEKKYITYHGDILFEDYMKWWVNARKNKWAETTYHTYKQIVFSVIEPYFKNRKIKLCDLKPLDIQRFYDYQMEENRKSANTIHHYHANIHDALKYAVKMEFISYNPADVIELPKKVKPHHNFYTPAELKILLNGVKNHTLEPVVLLGAWFGLRREEICGLKWQYVDFENKCLHVEGVLTYKGGLRYEQRTKTEKSTRVLNMPDVCVEYLQELKQIQERRHKRNQKYNKNYLEFVCVRENGDIIRPDYVTRYFPILCEKCGLKPIKFHELRHTNISLLVSSGEDVKKVQEWAGHSTYKTTMDIYGHLLPNNQSSLVKALTDVLC